MTRMQKKATIASIIFVCFLVAVTVLFFKDREATSQPVIIKTEPVHVEHREDGFYPKDITIRKGITVTFTTITNKEFWPASDIHPTHLIYPSFDPQQEIPPENTWSFTFDTAGTWRYHDHLTPTLVGTITVIE